MNFEEAISKLATKSAISRSANIQTGFRGHVEKEDLLSQKRLFLNDRRIKEEFYKSDGNYDFRRFLLYLLLRQENFIIDSNLSVLEREIKNIRRHLLTEDKYIQWDKKEEEIYGVVLDAVLEDKTVSSDEWNVLERLQKKLNMNIHFFIIYFALKL